METFFEDEFINSKVLSRIREEIMEEQLDKTIDEIGYLNELQNHVLSQYNKTEFDFGLKKFKKN